MLLQEEKRVSWTTCGSPAPALAKVCTAVRTLWIAGYSTHALVETSYEFQDRPREGLKARPGPALAELEQAIAHADPTVWDAPIPTSLPAAELYREWIRRLQAWLPLKNEIGYPKFEQVLDKMDGAAPVKPRIFQRANLARKADAHLRELAHLGVHELEDSVASARAKALLRALQRMPWEAWGVPPPVPTATSSTTWREVRRLVAWAHDHWQPLYQSIALSSRHALKSWSLNMHDSIRSGRISQLSKWAKECNALPVIRQDEKLLTHPQDIGESMRAAWQEVYSPDPCQPMSDTDIDFMAELIQPHCWEPGPVLAADLQRIAVTRRTGAAGLDRIHIRVLQALPVSAWQHLAEVFNGLETGQEWPESLCAVAMAAIPKSDSPDTVSAMKVRLIGITSHVYRVWSALRAEQANTQWLPKLMNVFTFGGLRKRSAKLANAVESLTWDKAHAADLPLFGAYLDSSRCFDSIKYEDILRLAGRLGCSPRVRNAMATWYASQTRTILVKGWASTAIQPLRGLPQGCPLSVTFCVLWNLSWNSRVAQILGQYAGSIWQITSYMDDFSLCSQHLGALQKALGWTQIHFEKWQIQLNLSKSSLAVNAKAGLTTELQEFQLQQSESCKLLGLTTGPTPSGAVILERSGKAQRLLDRLRRLSLPHHLMIRAVSMLVIPLLYGTDHAVDITQCTKDLEASIKRSIWGRARTATNWFAAKALCVPSHLVTPQGNRHVTILQNVWAFGAQEGLRHHLLHLWHIHRVPRGHGFWTAFIGVLAEAGMKLAENGGVAHQRTGQLWMHLCMSKRSWAHQSRRLWRRINLMTAAQRLPRIYDYEVDDVDWDASLLTKQLRHPMLDTIQSNSLNSKSRCVRHFRAPTSPYCEHGCAAEDDFQHRILDCPATQEVRRQCHLDDAALRVLRNQPTCTRSTAIWVLDPVCRNHVLQDNQAWGLWPLPGWIARVLELPKDRVWNIDTAYGASLLGSHPQLRRHWLAARVREEVSMHWETCGTLDMASRQDWEADILTLAGILAILSQSHVQINGLSTDTSRLWSLLEEGNTANAHLSRMVIVAKPRVSVNPAGVLLDASTLPPPVDINLPREAADSFERNYVLAKRVAEFSEKMMDCYPLAKELSRTHGWSRGGLSSSHYADWNAGYHIKRSHKEELSKELITHVPLCYQKHRQCLLPVLDAQTGPGFHGH